MLQPRLAAGFGRCPHLFFRVHVLQWVRKRTPRRHMPELRRRVASAPVAAGGQAWEVSGFDDAGVQAWRLRCGVLKCRRQACTVDDWSRPRLCGNASGAPVCRAFASRGPPLGPQAIQ